MAWLVDGSGRPLGDSLEARLERAEAAMVRSMAEGLYGPRPLIVITDAPAPPAAPQFTGLARALHP